VQNSWTFCGQIPGHINFKARGSKSYHSALNGSSCCLYSPHGASLLPDFQARFPSFISVAAHQDDDNKIDPQDKSDEDGKSKHFGYDKHSGM
jgi:hypothetical protein